MTEYSKAKEDSCWEEGHPIFKLAEHNDTLQATIADKDDEIARLKSNEKKAFWFGFERAVTNPSRNNIQTQWSDYKALTAINPIGDTT